MEFAPFLGEFGFGDDSAAGGEIQVGVVPEEAADGDKAGELAFVEEAEGGAEAGGAMELVTPGVL